MKALIAGHSLADSGAVKGYNVEAEMAIDLRNNN